MMDAQAEAIGAVSAVPDIVIRRLPIYLRTVQQLMIQGVEITSSQTLADLLGISSAQIRKDLSHFGAFGKQGTGYQTDYLCKQLTAILQVANLWPIILVGAGHLGHALANYPGFEQRGFRIVAVFDNDQKTIGNPIGSLVVQPLTALAPVVADFDCQIAILAVPARSAQTVAQQLITVGIQSMLCYTPTTLNLPKTARVAYVDPLIYLQHMTYYLEQRGFRPPQERRQE